MLNRYSLSSCLVGAAMIIVAAPTYAAEVITPLEIANTARSTVVLIQEKDNHASYGSGVIIGRFQEKGTNVYVVLTAEHVVRGADNNYNIITPKLQSKGNQRLHIDIEAQKDVERLPNVDLALVKFRSNDNFQTAILGNSTYTKQGSAIYVAGFPKPGAFIQRRLFQLTSSLVSTRTEDDDVDGGQKPNTKEKGYSIGYTNVTRGGMSGGPIFDETGRVVGIHGMGDRDNISIQNKQLEVKPSNSQNAESTEENIGGKTGFNWGIPIQTFLKLKPDVIEKMGVKFDDSEPGPGASIVVRGDEESKTIRRFNIVEEEDPAKDIIVNKVNNARYSNPVKPQQFKFPINNTSNSNSSTSHRKKFL